MGSLVPPLTFVPLLPPVPLVGAGFTSNVICWGFKGFGAKRVQVKLRETKLVSWSEFSWAPINSNESNESWRVLILSK